MRYWIAALTVLLFTSGIALADNVLSQKDFSLMKASALDVRKEIADLSVRLQALDSMLAKLDNETVLEKKAEATQTVQTAPVVSYSPVTTYTQSYGNCANGNCYQQTATPTYRWIRRR